MADGTDNTMEGASGAVLGFPVHPDRAGAIGEIHSRPFPLVATPRVLIKLAFMRNGNGDADHAALSALAKAHGLAAPQKDERHFVMRAGQGTLRWERHSEFSTYFWDGPLDPATGAIVGGHPFGSGFSAPGKVICGIRVDIRKWDRASEKLVEGFDPVSLCFSLVAKEQAAAVTDFRQDGDGLTRILILDRGLTPASAGALSQRLIEIETYRTLAMLGLPLAQQLSPSIGRMEERLADITERMKTLERGEGQELLEELTALAAGLEAEAASSLYRFGASKAYYAIVEGRLASIKESSIQGYQGWTSFLIRRLKPAINTVNSIQERQANLSSKLARAATLLRTWVDVELERQNRDLLTSMDRRAKLQLRLQQTVEGLSVAAVSYYVVGLIGYLAKGFGFFGLPVKPEYATAAAVPLVVLVIWMLVRRIRKAHGDH